MTTSVVLNVHLRVIGLLINCK